MGWVSHLDYFWAEPSFARFLGRLASFSRLILFDKRGTGLSDRVGELPTLEQRMDDVRAVMEAAGSERAALLGVSEGGPMCSLFAATYPEKTLALIMIGTYAKRVWDPEYPWAPTPVARERFYSEIRDHWGEPVGLAERAPSRANDPEFRAWWSTYLRMGASPGAALALTRMNAEIDVRHVLPSIRVPALVLHRTGDHCLHVEEGRYVAGLIPGSEWVELPGEDHLPFVGDQDAFLDRIEDFLDRASHTPEPDRVLATVLCARVDGVGACVAAEGSNRTAWTQHARKEVEWFRGQLLQMCDGLCAAFDGPARAIRCATALASSGGRYALRVRVGLHTGECDLVAGELTGAARNIACAVGDQAAPGEVMVSRTVKDLVAGSGLRFDDRGIHTLDGTGADWRLFAVDALRLDQVTTAHHAPTSAAS
jgi:pimeloyl-ACP methyl ester carboxylesterase